MRTSLDDVKKVLQENLDLDCARVAAVRENDALFDGLGLDSIDMMELIVVLRKEYGIVLGNADEVKEVFKTLGSLRKYIEEKRIK